MAYKSVAAIFIISLNYILCTCVIIQLTQITYPFSKNLADDDMLEKDRIIELFPKQDYPGCLVFINRINMK